MVTQTDIAYELAEQYSDRDQPAFDELAVNDVYQHSPNYVHYYSIWDPAWQFTMYMLSCTVIAPCCKLCEEF